MPFKNSFARDRHFERHGAEVGAKTADEYEKMAETFMAGPVKPGIRECFRVRDGALARFSPSTAEFGVASRSGEIYTYMLVLIPATSSDTPLAYFERDCRKGKN